MCKHKLILLLLIPLIIFPTLGAAQEGDWIKGLATQTAEALSALGVKPGSANLCVLTNAPYVKVGNEPAAACLNKITEITGCSRAKGNLLSYHNSVSKPLRVVLFDKGTGDGIVLTLCGAKEAGERVTDPCSPVSATVPSKGVEQVKLHLGGDEILEPDAYGKIMAKLGPPDAFSITSILNAWAAGAPPDFLKAAEFHNHYCPGVISGYLISGLVSKKYPLEKGQKYVWIGAPPKCGDDAIQVLLDLTPGKRSCFIKGLTAAQRKAITIEEPLNNVQGILIVWDNKKNQGKGLVLKYDWGKACKIGGVKFADFRPPKGHKDPRFFTTRLKVNKALISYLDKPSELVSVAKEIRVTPEMYVKMISAGSNPYQVVGLTAK